MVTVTCPRTLRWYAGAGQIFSGQGHPAVLFPIYSHSSQSGVTPDLSKSKAPGRTYRRGSPQNDQPPNDQRETASPETAGRRSGQRPWFATASAAAAAAFGSR